MTLWQRILALLILLACLAPPAWAAEELGRQEDSASADGHVVVPMGCVRADSPAASTSADGDYTHVKCKSDGYVYVQALLEASSAAIGKLAANSGVIIGDVNIAGSLPTGTNTLGNIHVLSIAPGTGATALGKSEDGTHTSGDTGVMLLGVRHDTSSTGLGVDGDYAALGLDALGQLYTKADTELPAATLLADNTTNPTLPAVAAYIMCWDTATWDRCPGGLTDTDDGTIATNQAPNLAINLTYRYDGSNWTRPRFDPCESGSKIIVPISQTTGTQLLGGTASLRTYVCAIHVVTATAQNIALVSGTGSICATSTAAMAGGTTAATGWNFAANGGLVLGTGGNTVAKSNADANNVCLLQSGSGQISGSLSYVAAAN